MLPMRRHPCSRITHSRLEKQPADLACAGRSHLYMQKGTMALLLGALCQSCAPTDVHVHTKSAISAASRTVHPVGPLASEFLEAAKLEGKNFAATRIAEQHYLSVALKAWAALQAARDQSDPTLLEIHNQAIADYLQFVSAGDLAIGRADEVVDGRHIKIVLRDGAKPNSPPGFD